MTKSNPTKFLLIIANQLQKLSLSFFSRHANSFLLGRFGPLAASGFRRDARMAILTSFAPVRCFASNVAGDVADVSVLVPPNAGPHDYSFSPADIQKIAKADVLVINGAGLENWLQRGSRAQAGKTFLVVDTSAGIHLITGLDVRPLPGVHSQPDPDAGGTNPHIWLSPVNAIKQVENIREALVSRDPANAETYRANAVAYIRKLPESRQ